jgi:hypothetical protein
MDAPLNTEPSPPKRDEASSLATDALAELTKQNGDAAPASALTDWEAVRAN